MHTQDFVDTINAKGGSYRLNEEGKIEIIPLSYALTVENSYAETTGAGRYGGVNKCLLMRAAARAMSLRAGQPQPNPGRL